MARAGRCERQGDEHGKLACSGESGRREKQMNLPTDIDGKVYGQAATYYVTDEIPGAWLASLTSAERKEVAVARGLYAYFPDALALIARHSVRSNEKHNPGEPVHWARGKSNDQEDCIARHSLAVAIDPDSLDGGEPHIICRAWRALAALQLWAEAKHAKGEKL